MCLCYHSCDKPAVRRIADAPRRCGLRPWLDEKQIRPGERWQDAVERTLATVKAAAVCFGPQGTGERQGIELQALLQEFVDRALPVIPVILPDCPGRPRCPLFLREMAWVDFRR